MASAVRVFGPAVLFSGAGSDGTGTAPTGTLTALGVSEDGVRISFTEMTKGVITDVGGEAPVDYQRRGSQAIIRCKLVDYDVALLNAMRRPGGQALTSADDGIVPPVGRMIGSGGHSARLIIIGNNATSVADGVNGANDGRPYRFWNVFLDANQDFKVGSEYTTEEIVFRAWVFLAAGAVSTTGRRLYDRVGT